MQSNSDHFEIKSTKDYLQDISKVIGKFQQIFLVPDKNYWHVGLKVTDKGFATQEFKINGENCVIEVDLRDGKICTSQESWGLGGVTAIELWHDLNMWAEELGVADKFKQPEIGDKPAICEQSPALLILNMLSISKKLLGGSKLSEQKGRLSPLLLYPHHFDLAFSWYPNSEQQYTLGFSLGDETIAKPYFYITAYPESMEFASRTLSEPARRQSSGFNGAVLLFDDVQAGNAGQIFGKFVQEALDI